MSTSSIEWTDATWNPVSGCTRVSAGCDHCYAVSMTKRLESMGQEKYSGLVNIGKGHFNGVVKCHEDALTIPLKARKPRRWFVNSMSDLFHKEVPFDFIDRVFAVMALCPQHTFQILTKRPERMFEYLDECATEDIRAHAIEMNPPRAGERVDGPVWFSWPLPNVWLGTSVENQETADERIPHLLRCPAAVRFLSCEPLLGPADLTEWLDRWSFDCEKCGDNGTVIGMPGQPCGSEMEDGEFCDGHISSTRDRSVDWVIVGGESGPGARPMRPDWARSLRDQCVAAGVPYFFKQWGGVDKKATGRILDGRTWDEFPVVSR